MRAQLAGGRAISHAPVFDRATVLSSGNQSIRRHSMWNNASAPAAPGAPAFPPAVPRQDRATLQFAETLVERDVRCQRKLNRRLPTALADEPKPYVILRDAWSHCHAIQPVNVANQIVSKPQDFLDSLQALVLSRCFLEIHLLAQAVAGSAGRADHCRAVSGQEFPHSLHFAQVLLASDDLLARPQAHVHFAVDAAGMLRARLQVFLAAADLEQIQALVLEQLGAGARAKRTVVQSRSGTQSRRYLRARKLIG